MGASCDAGLNEVRVETGFIALLLIFAVIYFGVLLPLFQHISQRVYGRRFVIRLGTPWRYSNRDHRWDVFMSVCSFVVALGLSLFLLDTFFPLADAVQ